MWDATVDDDELACARSHALQTAGASSTPMRDAHGAAGAHVAVFKHLGWENMSTNTILTDELGRQGNPVTIDLRATFPRVVYMMAARRLHGIGAASSSLVAQIGGIPELEPLQTSMKGKLSGDANAMRSLRAMGEGG